MMAFAHRPIIRRGCYCSISLRACALTLAIFNLVCSLFGLATSTIIDLRIVTHPTESFNDDFNNGISHKSYNSTTENPLSNSTLDSKDFIDVDAEGPGEHHRLLRLLVAVVFDSLNLLLQFANIIMLIVLIVGAVRRLASCIRPWIFLGSILIAFDITYFFVHTSIGFHFTYSISCVFSSALNTWLWLVSYSLYQECRELERRNKSGRLTMSELEADQREESCSVPYADLSDKLP